MRNYSLVWMGQKPKGGRERSRGSKGDSSPSAVAEGGKAADVSRGKEPTVFADNVSVTRR